MEEVQKQEKKVLSLDEVNSDYKTEMHNRAVIKVEKEDKIYYFDMPFGAPLNECYEAAVEVLKKIRFSYEEAVKKIREEAENRAKETSESSESSEAPAAEEPPTQG